MPALHGGNPVGRGGVGRPANVRNVVNEERILECFEVDPTRSVRTASQLLDLSKSTIHSVLKVKNIFINLSLFIYMKLQLNLLKLNYTFAYLKKKYYRYVNFLNS